MDRRASASRLASALWLATLAVAVAGGVLQVVTRDLPVEFYGVRGFQAPLGVMSATIGWLVVRSRPRNPIGWIFVGVGILSAFQAFNGGYLALSVAEYGGSLPLTEVGTWLSVWIWVLIVGPLTTYLLLLFPEERLASRGLRFLAVYDAVAITVFGVAISFTPDQAGEAPLGLTNPFAIDAASHDQIMSGAGPLFIIAIASSAVVLIRRFRRSRGERRQQLKWLAYMGSIAVAVLVASLIVQLGTSAGPVAVRVAAIATIVGFVSVLVAPGVAILRYGLYEIDIVINKTIVYALLAVFISVVYVAVVIGIGALVGSGANTGLSVAATGIVALAIQPARARANKLANRLVYGKRASPYEALSAFAASLSDGVATEDTLPRLARLMTEATAATSAGVWFAVGDELRPGGVWPERSVSPQPIGAAVGDRVFEVRHEDELLGVLAVEVSPAEPLTPTQEQLLGDLASQAGLLLRNVRLIEELRASRQRLVAAQDQERRRIERDLHDGAQQQLVALAVNLKLARNVLQADAAQADTMLEQLQAEASGALENLRDLARGIYPPLLADRGLVEALRSQAAKASLPVDVDGDGIGRYPQEAEAAVYFCVLEALQNIAKYAEASRAHVRLGTDDGMIRFEVTDDGKGFDVRAATRGAGMTNMADRLDALGGTLEVRSSPGRGTTISGRVPAAAVPSAN